MDLALSSYDFAHAKNDNQRFTSGLRAGAAVYVLASGPYAPAVALAVTAAILIDSSLAAHSAVELLQIYKQIEEYEKTVVQIKTVLARADGTALDIIIAKLHEDLAAASEADQGLKTQCTDASKVNTLAEFDICVFWISSFYMHAQEFVYGADKLLNWNSEFVSNERLFELSGLKREELKKARDAYAATLKDSEHVRRDFTKSYVDVFTDIIIRKALDTSAFSTEEYLASNCQDAASKLIHASDGLMLELVRRSEPYSDLEKSAQAVRANTLLTSMALFGQSSCEAFAKSGQSPEKVLLQEWLIHLAHTKGLLEVYFAEFQ
jgi:hypothetical protein